MLVDSKMKTWVPFKNENLLIFCFNCGRMGHGVKDCELLSSEEKHNEDPGFPYLVVLRVESNLMGKENFQFNLPIKKYGP